MVIRALPVLTGDGLTWAETFLDTGMHLTPFVTPTKQWRPVTGATYMAANSLMQTAQSVIRGTVRGILAQRRFNVRVAVTWASHVDTCARVLAVSAQRTRFWFHHSVRVTLYAAHRAHQRVLLGTLSSLRRLTTRVLRHKEMLELELRCALAHLATVARANYSHQQLAYQKFRTWAAMVTHKQGGGEGHVVDLRPAINPNTVPPNITPSSSPGYVTLALSGVPHMGTKKQNGAREGQLGESRGKLCPPRPQRADVFSWPEMLAANKQTTVRLDMPLEARPPPPPAHARIIRTRHGDPWPLAVKPWSVRHTHTAQHTPRHERALCRHPVTAFQGERNLSARLRTQGRWGCFREPSSRKMRTAGTPPPPFAPPQGGDRHLAHEQ